jgi:sortase A
MRRRIVIACAVLGAALLVQSGWIHAKALLAQVLIARAWERTLAGDLSARPWPWADTTPVARLMLPGAPPRTVTVLAGASGRNLAFGPVHDSASVLPGEPGNSVIAAHRDTHFRSLRTVRVGDRLYVERADGTSRVFAVVDRRVVDARTTRILLDSDAARLTLVTCHPFDAIDPRGPMRLVITADAVQVGDAFTWHTVSSR